MKNRSISFLSLLILGTTSLMPLASLAMPTTDQGNNAIASRRNLTYSADERNQLPTMKKGLDIAPLEGVTMELTRPMPEPNPIRPSVIAYPLPPFEASPIVDDGDKGFVQTGNWTVFPLSGFNGDLRFAASSYSRPCNTFEDRPCPISPIENSEAEWNFKYIKTGKYDVFVTWKPFDALASNATYSVTPDNSTTKNVSVNQTKEPKGPKFEGVKWQKLGTFSVSRGIVVTLNNAADGYVVADAVRIVLNDTNTVPIYKSACWSCRGGTEGQCEANLVECLTKKQWEKIAKESCGPLGIERFSVNDKCDQDPQECASAGTTIPVVPDGPVCCEGLRPIAVAFPGESQPPSREIESSNSCTAILGSMICSNCGDGICEEWENECNCSDDCKETNPVCGNGICEKGESDESDPGGCGPISDPSCLGPPATFYTGTCPQDCEISEDTDGPKEQCATYIRDAEKIEHCAKCGNDICEAFERCTSSHISGGMYTDDCGGLYCPGDCQSIETLEPEYDEVEDILLERITR
ncbi:MAG: hypothetical protein K9M03_02925 [Kiritimatiellales bacterium]|nr:hypothetical protein [Kiritimatiellales bacterium]